METTSYLILHKYIAMKWNLQQTFSTDACFKIVTTHSNEYDPYILIYNIYC